MLTLKNSFVTLLFLLAATLSTWSIYVSSKKPAQTHVDSTLPDAFMENVIATIINKEGDPSLQIKSPKMIHYPENDTTHIETPHITIFRQSPEPWIVNSDFAKASKGIQQIDFWSNVVIHHEHDIKAPITTMTTTSLTVFPSEKIAQTEDAIVLTQPDTTIHAIGMYANLNEGYVKLLSAARGEYVPKP